MSVQSMQKPHVNSLVLLIVFLWLSTSLMMQPINPPSFLDTRSLFVINIANTFTHFIYRLRQIISAHQHHHSASGRLALHNKIIPAMNCLIELFRARH